MTGPELLSFGEIMHDLATDTELPREEQLLFQLRSLGFNYADGHCALQDIDLDIFTGDRIALVGQNGAGKTTLVKHLNGTRTNQAGSLLYKGQSIQGDNLIRARRQVGILFQDPDDHLFNNTIYEDVAFGPMNQGLPRDVVDERVRKALERVELDHLMFKAPNNLSLGQKKRAAFAAIMVMEPEVLILDEPTANLDSKHEKIFDELLLDYRGTLICISHDLLFLYGLCSRAVVLDHGRIHHDYTLNELVSHRASLREHGLDFTFRFIDCCHSSESHDHSKESQEHTASHEHTENLDHLALSQSDKETAVRIITPPMETVPDEKSQIIRLENYSFQYKDGTWGFKDINMTINEGEKIAIVGENGAGKSTLAGCILGIKQGGGKYYFKNDLITHSSREKLWRQIGMVFQDSSDQLFCPSCEEEVAFGPKQMGLSPLELEKRVTEALALVKLSGFEKRVPMNLSGGERKRLAIAAVLSMHPQVLILDEPSANLDPRNEELLLHILHNLPVTQILISHDMFFVNNSSHRTVVMQQGSIISDLPTYDFIHDEHLVGHQLDYAYKNICGREILKMQEAVENGG